MVETFEIKRIVRSISNNPVCINDINIRLNNYGDEVELFHIDNLTKKPYRTLDQITSSLDLKRLIKNGSVELETETGLIYNHINIDPEEEPLAYKTILDTNIGIGYGGVVDLTEFQPTKKTIIVIDGVQYYMFLEPVE